MSNVTVINPDSKVYVDGEALEFEFSLDSNIWAIQWNGTSGDIEYKDNTPNLTIDSIDEYQYLIDAHATEKARLAAIDEENPVTEPTYVENRAVAYPPVGDQLDALFHAGVFPDEMAATLQAVKDAYPKP